jgi:hypothetical protein
MNASKPWIRVVILAGVAYFVVGKVFTLSTGNVKLWRLAAWVVSGAIYAAHISYEHFRLHNRPRVTAQHTALAVALGAFFLAVAATVHALTAVSHAAYWRYLLAFVLWPIVTAVPAFLIALGAAAMLDRLPTKH